MLFSPAHFLNFQKIRDELVLQATKKSDELENMTEKKSLRFLFPDMKVTQIEPF